MNNKGYIQTNIYHYHEHKDRTTQWPCVFYIGIAWCQLQNHMHRISILRVMKCNDIYSYVSPQLLMIDRTHIHHIVREWHITETNTKETNRDVDQSRNTPGRCRGDHTPGYPGGRYSVIFPGDFVWPENLCRENGLLLRAVAVHEQSECKYAKSKEGVNIGVKNIT